MDKRIINEIEQIKTMMGIKESDVDEQVISAASKGSEEGLRGTDDEYQLLGLIELFMSAPIHDKDSFDNMGDHMDWIKNYKSPVAKFGKSLFEYLNGTSSNYDKKMFDALMRVFNTEGVFEDMGVDKPSTEEMIQSGKNTRDFKYNITST